MRRSPTRPARVARSAALALVASVAVLSTACHATPEAKTPAGHSAALGNSFAAAFQAEMTDPLADGGYLDAIDAAVADPDSPESLGVVVASLHSLVLQRDIDPARLGMPIAFRSRESMQKVVLRLRQAWDALEGVKSSRGALLRAHIARALHEAALYSGESRGANVWAGRRGCATRATVLGPVDWAPLSSLDQPSPVDEKALKAEYPGLTQLKPATVPIAIDADACQLDTHAAGTYSGVFDVVVDVDNPTEQTLSFLVTTSAASSLRAGGQKVVDRSYDLGSPAVTVMGQAHATAGTVRLVLRVADRGDSTPIELDVVGEDGQPLQTKAPRPGDAASATVTAPKTIAISESPGDAGQTLQAAALLSLGQTRTAEHDIEAFRIAGGKPSPALDLLYVRAMESSSDTPDARRIERTKSAIDEVLKAEPSAWEAKLVQTELTQRKKGVGDGVFAALKEMGISTPSSDLSKLGPTELFGVIGLALNAGVDDVAERAYAELAKRTPGSALLARADSILHRRTGREAVQAECNGGGDRSSTSCMSALLAVGDRKGAKNEIVRLRELRASPSALLSSELELAVADGDGKRALEIYDSMPPGMRSIVDILPLLGTDRAAAEARIRRDIMTAQDGIQALSQLGILFQEPNSDARRFEEEGRAIVELDRQKKQAGNDATSVLRHVEHYGLDESGLLHVFMYDLRHIGGTTDVEQTGGGLGVYVEGRGSGTTLRRRIYKKDGRVLEPDTADSSQGGGDLSQLEKGDYIEEISTAYYLPTEAGQLTLDTNDLLPERTTVADAEIVLRLPEKLEIPIWAHALLGKPAVENKDGYKYITYRLKNQGARRLEDGIPQIEQGVRVSLSTQTWANIARSIRETILSLGDSDPFIARFADEAAKGEGAPAGAPKLDLATVTRVVDHVGRTIKIANGGGQISDMAASYGGGPQGQTARYMIEDRQGSRSWVVYRTLKQLGFDADIAVAETSPFSSSPDFPPHPGRFSYPLVVVHLPEGDKWIDSDIQGPPLPPGRVSPELRGRSAVLSSGKIIPVAGSTDSTFDDVDIELAVDGKGTAKGKIGLSLRGRQAQALSESFNTIVGSDRRELLRRVVQSWMPWADVDDVHLQSAEGAWEVVIQADISVHGFGSPEGRDGHTFVLSGLEPTRGGTLTQTYASRGDRQSALSIDSPIQYHVKRRIELAPGMSVVKPPASVDVKSGFLSGERTTKIEGQVLSEEFVLNVPTGTIGADRYAAFVDDVQTIDSGFLAGIRVKAP